MLFVQLIIYLSIHFWPNRGIKTNGGRGKKKINFSYCCNLKVVQQVATVSHLAPSLVWFLSVCVRLLRLSLMTGAANNKTWDRWDQWKNKSGEYGEDWAVGDIGENRMLMCYQWKCVCYIDKTSWWEQLISQSAVQTVTEGNDERAFSDRLVWGINLRTFCSNIHYLQLMFIRYLTADTRSNKYNKRI